jgi:hypothetical protein
VENGGFPAGGGIDQVGDAGFQRQTPIAEVGNRYLDRETSTAERGNSDFLWKTHFGDLPKSGFPGKSG